VVMDASDQFDPTVDDLVENNRRFSEAFTDRELQVRPTRNMAVVTCMDSRMDVFALLGLGNGEAHIIRNAGGVITDEVVLIHHTNCGLQLVTEDGLKSELEAELGIKPWWSVESFDDPYVDVRQSMKRLEMTPFVPFKDHVSGFVYDVQTGLLDEVHLDDG
jgi:carbonic anhydrase